MCDEIIAVMELNNDHRRILRLVAEQASVSRASLSAETGWARATVAQRLSDLVDARWLLEVESGAGAGRGRPSTMYELNARSAMIFVLSFGQTQVTTALVDLDGRPVISQEVVFASDAKVEQATQFAKESSSHLDALLAKAGRSRSEVRICVTGKPGPVDPEDPDGPLPMPGWVSVRVRDIVESALGIPTILENDANLMALGSWASEGRPTGPYVFVKVALGIGAGILLDGRILRGRRGMAGEIGHSPVSTNSTEPCSCGQTTCVTQAAGVPAILREMQRHGSTAETVDDLAELAVHGDPIAASVLRQAGRYVGEALLGLVATLAPDTIVLGGRVSQLADHLVTGARETLYSRSVPALTAGMRVLASRNHRELALKGAGMIGLESLIERGVDLSDRMLPQLAAPVTTSL